MNFKLLIILFLISILCLTCKKDKAFDKNSWELTYREEFSDSIINWNKWSSNFQWGQYENESDKQYYIDSAFKINNGILSIIAKRDTVLGNVFDSNNNPVKKAFNFTSGLIHTDKSKEAFSQQYGYFEARIKAASGKGLWSAFWMLTNNHLLQETDIFEIFGEKPTEMLMTNHYSNSKGERQMNSHVYNNQDLTKEFHIYGLEWNSKEIIRYLDGKKVFYSEIGIPTDRMFLVLSLGVSGEVEASTIFPSSFDIDYVRVYKKKSN